MVTWDKGYGVGLIMKGKHEGIFLVIELSCVWVVRQL